MSQILSQDEVDALLRGVSDGEIETEAEDLGDDSGVVPYDLTSQERIIRGRMPTLDIINQRFSRLFRNSLSVALRKALDVSAVSTDTVKFGEFIKSLPVPASIHVFRINPLRGFALLVAESKMAFALVDSFLGGSGDSKMKIEGRDFTAIEQRLIKNVVLMMLKDMQKAWAPVHPVEMVFDRSEVNPQFAAIVPPTDVVVVILYEIEMDQFAGTITVCLPYSTIEPIIGKLKAGFQSDQLEVDLTWVRRLRERLAMAEVDVKVLLGEATMSAQDFLNLKKGSIIQLNTDVTEELSVLVSGIEKFRGFPGVVRGSKALRIAKQVARQGAEKKSRIGTKE